MTEQTARNAICLCVDRNMVVQGLFVACSIVRHLSDRRPRPDVILVVPAGDPDPTQRAFADANGILIDESMDLASLGDVPIPEGRLTSATLMKLLLAGHYLRKYGKILYLDADLTIHNDLGRLFDLDMGAHALAAVPSGQVLTGLPESEVTRIRTQFARLGMTPPYRYFNSGVMLIEPASWSRQRITERALDFARAKPELCLLVDEDSLNAVLDGDFLALSTIWNAPPIRMWASDFEPAILHYAGDIKPWRRFGRRKRLGEQRAAYELYKAFIANSPWPHFLRSQWSFKDVCGSMVCELEQLARSGAAALSRESRRQKRMFLDDYRRYIAETDFADVAQGIAERKGTVIRCGAA